MTIQTSIHDVRQMNIIRKGTLPNYDRGDVATTSVQIVDENGEVLTLTLFHPVGDLPVTISEK